MNTDPDPQLLAHAQSLEVGQESPFFSTCRSGNPRVNDVKFGHCYAFNFFCIVLCVFACAANMTNKDMQWLYTRQAVYTAI